jgi:hypothetical protein
MFNTDEAVLERRRARLAADVDLEHPWVKQYRVPVLHDLYPGWSFLATITVPREGRQDFLGEGFLPVTEDDAILVGKYITYYRKHWYNARYMRELDRMPLDLDGGANTVSFARMEQGWVFRRFSWRDQAFAPYRDAKVQYPTLLELMDHITSFGDKPSADWEAFKAEHGLSVPVPA